MAVIAERTTGLAEPEEVQAAGYDARQWEIVHDLEPQPAVAAEGPSAPGAVRAPSDGEPAPADARTAPPGA
jgi:hypothetical protein